MAAALFRKVQNMRLGWANRITIVRILLIPVFVIFMLKINHHDPSFAKSMRYAALVTFLFMVASDILDGYVARKNRQITSLGSFLDPMADKLLMTCACLLLASGRTAVKGFELPPTVVVLIIGKDFFLMLGFTIVFLMTAQARIVPVVVGKLACTLQLSMVAAILLAPEFSTVLPGWIWLLRTLWWSAAATAILATIIYIRNGNRYIEEFEEQTTGIGHNC
ncbi:MAG: CDP-alcohol phosphatidyltransferase family protein [Planctomycetota bacterium]